MIFNLRQRCRILLAVLTLVLTACQNIDSAGEPLVQSQSWRVDSTGQATLQDMEAASDWTTLQGWKSWGFGTETIWVRIELRGANQKTGMPWIVRVRPAFLDHITLYDPTSGYVMHTGDGVRPNESDLESINFSIPIPALPDERSIYLQIQSTSARTLMVEVLPYGQAQRFNRLHEWGIGLATVASLIFAIWAFFQWRTSRERVIGAFAVKQIFTTAWAFCMLGFARIVVGPWLPEGYLTMITSTVFPLTVSATFWFFCTLLEGYQPSHLALRVCRSFAFVTALLPLMQWLAPAHLMLEIANLSILVAFALLLITLLSALPKRIKQPIPLIVLLVYLLTYSILNSMPPLIHLGWIQESAFVLFGGLAHAVLDGMVMFVLLQIRAHSLQKEQLQTALALQRSQQQTEDEKRYREEQSQLFAMLAHEMKTPLATLRMWMDAGQLKPETMARAIIDMNSVIERCVHTGQLADQGLRPAVQMVNPVAVSLDCITTCRAPDQVDWAAHADSGLLQTDAQMLSIVLGNLLDNACKYSAPGSRIQFTLQSSSQAGQLGWLWQLRNQAGPAGLPDTSHMFEKYYRSPQARRLSGSGLGLFLVKGLLELMKGSITYEAQDGGAVFSIWLPAKARAR